MKTFTERPADGGSYSFDPATGLYTQLEAPPAPPVGKSAAKKAAATAPATETTTEPAPRARGRKE